MAGWGEINQMLEPNIEARPISGVSNNMCAFLNSERRHQFPLRQFVLLVEDKREFCVQKRTHLRSVIL